MIPDHRESPQASSFSATPHTDDLNLRGYAEEFSPILAAEPISNDIEHLYRA